MNKVYRLKDLDCANCAAKMEAKIAKLEGVKGVSVNFMSQKMIIDFDGEEKEVMQEVQNICKRVEPDCKILGI